jgi:hypothetical protein
MRGTQGTSGGKRIGRRAFLAGVGVALGTAVTSGTAGAYHDQYDPVDVVDAGAANDGSESITGILEDLAYGNDEVALEFPPGEYLMDRQLRFTDFDSFAMFGDDATIRPAPADEFEGPARLFKLGTGYAPGDWVRIEHVDFDFTEPNTGLRALQVQANDLYVNDVNAIGKHDTGTWGPFLFDVLDPDAIAVVKNLSAPDGGEYTVNTAGEHYPTTVGGGGPTGIIVGPSHEGKLWFKHCELGGFPDNGLYSSADEGTVVVYGGEYRNSNVANIRLDGQHNYVKHVTIEVNETRENDGNQRGIRLDDGSDFWIYDTEIRMPSCSGEAIRVTNGADDTTIQEVSIAIDDDEDAEDAISVSGGAGRVVVFDSEIEVRSGGQAIDLEPADDFEPALVEDVTITGEADGGYGGAHAIRCERDGSRFYDLTVDQPGDDYRRALAVAADDCIVAFGEYRSTHHPIVNAGEGTGILGLEAEAYNGNEAIKLYETDDVSIYDNVLHEGIDDVAEGSAEVYANSYPDP